VNELNKGSVLRAYQELGLKHCGRDPKQMSLKLQQMVASITLARAAFRLLRSAGLTKEEAQRSLEAVTSFESVLLDKGGRLSDDESNANIF